MLLTVSQVKLLRVKYASDQLLSTASDIMSDPEISKFLGELLALSVRLDCYFSLVKVYFTCLYIF